MTAPIQTTPQAIEPTRRTVTIAEACAMLGIPRSSGYELARADRFPVPTIQAGRRRVVPLAPLMRLLDPQADQARG